MSRILNLTKHNFGIINRGKKIMNKDLKKLIFKSISLAMGIATLVFIKKSRSDDLLCDIRLE